MLLAVVAFTFYLKPPMLGGCFSGYPNSGPSMHIVLGYMPHIPTTMTALPNLLTSWLSAAPPSVQEFCPLILLAVTCKLFRFLA